MEPKSHTINAGLGAYGKEGEILTPPTNAVVQEFKLWAITAAKIIVMFASAGLVFLIVVWLSTWAW